MKLIFATSNRHKVEELKAIIGTAYHVISLAEAGIDINIPEPYDTLHENASEKSKVIYALTNMNCFSEDTGLEVDALGGEPGVKSARYAGDQQSFDANIDKLLGKLKGHTNRKARFRTVISLLVDGRETLFEGTCDGRITDHRRGKGGFGYDPVFIPDGANHTFAEMSLAEKAEYSHRRKATDKLVAYLNKTGN